MTDEIVNQGPGVIIDQPYQIEAFRLLAIRSGLELEIKMQQNGWSVRPGMGGPTRGLALRSARATLHQYKVPGPARSRKQALAGIRKLCQQLGLAPSRQEQLEQQSKEDS